MPEPIDEAINTDLVRISVIKDPADFLPVCEISSKCFGSQNQDVLWKSLSPGWDTLQGREASAARYAEQLRNRTFNRDGDPNIVFLKAATPSGRIVGAAVWWQLSFAEGWGDVPLLEVRDIEALYPDDADGVARRFASQLYTSALRCRVDNVRARIGSDVPAVFVLHLCAVEPEYQRRGIGRRLVRWGLEEARRRGGLEASVEASHKGRPLYESLGFRPVAEIEYEFEPGVMESYLKGRPLTYNLFMKTGA